MANPGLTDEEMKEALEAYFGSNCNVTAAAEALGLHRPTFANRLRRAQAKFQSGGALKSDIDNRIADGFKPKAYSHLTRTETGELIWLKANRDEQEALEAFKGAVEDLCADLRGKAPLTPPPAHCDADLLTVVPMGDPHFGLLSWKPETGEDFNLATAEEVAFGAVDLLASLTPATGTAMLLNLGDYFHADDSTNRTPRGQNVLDTDSRFVKTASVGFRAMIRCVDRLLEKHGRVIVRNNPGNHDPHQAQMLTIAVSAYYHDCERVMVETSPSSFYYHRFGKVLIGSTHGDGAKLGDLPLIMANDVPDEWSASRWRVWHVGHFHHNQKMGQKDLVGCEVETHRTLAAGDAWHRNKGYRSHRDMKAIVYHKDYGEVNRIRCGIEMLEA